MLEMAIVENVQRKDLNPIERAKAFQRLKEEFSLDNPTIARKVSKSIPYVINCLKLLTLPDAIKDGLLSGLITEGHARALGGIGDTRLMIEAYKIVLKEKASVRRAEEIARRMRQKLKKVWYRLPKKTSPNFSVPVWTILVLILSQVLKTGQPKLKFPKPISSPGLFFNFGDQSTNALISFVISTNKFATKS